MLDLRLLVRSDGALGPGLGYYVRTAKLRDWAAEDFA